MIRCVRGLCGIGALPVSYLNRRTSVNWLKNLHFSISQPNPNIVSGIRGLHGIRALIATFTTMCNNLFEDTARNIESVTNELRVRRMHARVGHEITQFHYYS